jgi:hypothetical protein
VKKTILYGVSVGIAGGALPGYAGLVTPVFGLSLGSVYGLIFCLLAGPRVNTPGGGLLWGLAFALVFWLIGPASIGALFVSASSGSTTMLDTVRARFQIARSALLAGVLGVSVVLATSCSSTATGFNPLLISSVPNNQQATNSQDDSFYHPPGSPALDPDLFGS